MLKRLFGAALSGCLVLGTIAACSSDPRSSVSHRAQKLTDGDPLTIARAIYARIADRRTASDDYSVGVLSAETYSPAEYEGVDFTTQVGLPTDIVTEQPSDTDPPDAPPLARLAPLEVDTDTTVVFSTSRSVQSILDEARTQSPDMPEVQYFTILQVHTHVAGDDRVTRAIILWFAPPDLAILDDPTTELSSLSVVDYVNYEMLHTYADPMGGGGPSGPMADMIPAPGNECKAYSVDVDVMGGGVKSNWSSNGHWRTGPNYAHYAQEGMKVNCTCHANCNSSCRAQMTQTECKDSLFEHVMGSTSKATGETQFAGNKRGARCAGGQSCVVRYGFLGMASPPATDVYIRLRDDPQYPDLPSGVTMNCAAPCVQLMGDTDHFRGMQLGDSFTFECPACPGSNAVVSDFVGLQRDCSSGKPVYTCVKPTDGAMFFQSCNYAQEWVKQNDPDPDCTLKKVTFAVATAT